MSKLPPPHQLTPSGCSNCNCFCCSRCSSCSNGNCLSCSRCSSCSNGNCLSCSRCSNCSGCSKFSYLSKKTPKYNCSNKYHHQKIPATLAALIAPTAPLLQKQASLLKLFPLPLLLQWVKLCSNFSSFPDCSNCSNYFPLLQL